MGYLQDRLEATAKDCKLIILDVNARDFKSALEGYDTIIADLVKDRDALRELTQRLARRESLEASNVS